ncbi:deoxyuridine 5'-triphosphate nucleotidohydrolase [Brazilian porcupinepox virus 1]|nr:deoxyuridine 5'-triphosphate nucleotidohydrolase [Brazilian porcupinepox virus 1]
MSSVKCYKLSESGKLPKRSSDNSAGYDLFSAYDYIINPSERLLIKTDVVLEIPDGCYGRIAPRSGLSLKNNIDIGGGVIDCDYRGNIGVILINNGKCKYSISKGDRIAQIIFEKVEYPNIEEVNNITKTNRDNMGFGSTGK